MTRATKTQLDRLLARREEPSPLEQEAMLSHLLEVTAPAPRPWLRWGVWSFAAAAAAAVMLVWGMPGATTSEFLPRGVREPSVQLACLRGGVPSACAARSELVFKVGGLTGYLTVLAQREGQTNWYFVGLPLPDLATPRALDQAVVISPEHGAGIFDVIFLESRQPLDQDQARALLQHPERDPQVRVLRRTLEIVP